jgi:protein SCO1/2
VPRPLHRLAVALAAGALLLTACGGGSEDPATVRGGDDDGYHGVRLPQAYEVVGTPLTDTSGAAYSLTDDTDRPLTLVFFGYTNCPDICQTVMAGLASAMTRLDEAQREQVDVVFVTTDPARDDEQTLRTYLDRFDPTFIGLTGDLDQITEIAGSVSVFVEQGKKLPSGGYEVDHGTPVIGITADDRAPLVWTAGTSSAQIAEDISKELAA